MASKTKNKYSVCKVIDKQGKTVGYLSSRDEEKGKDIELSNRGFKRVAI